MTTTPQPSSTVLNFLTRFPIVRFSVYTHSQMEIVGGISTEILQLLDSSIEGQTVDGQTFQRIYGQFWLWVLGAYEIARTMSEYKTCFSAPLAGDVDNFKRSIALLRIPFAKQQFAGRDRLISNEASVSIVDTERKDIGFSVDGKTIWIRTCIADFDRLIRSIELMDVLHDLRDAPASK